MPPISVHPGELIHAFKKAIEGFNAALDTDHALCRCVETQASKLWTKVMYPPQTQGA
jgi:hypothetical protein